jgi:hypothetical protein
MDEYDYLLFWSWGSKKSRDVLEEVYHSFFAAEIESTSFQSTDKSEAAGAALRVGLSQGGRLIGRNRRSNVAVRRQALTDAFGAQPPATRASSH